MAIRKFNQGQITCFNPHFNFATEKDSPVIAQLQFFQVRKLWEPLQRRQTDIYQTERLQIAKFVGQTGDSGAPAVVQIQFFHLQHTKNAFSTRSPPTRKNPLNLERRVIIKYILRHRHLYASVSTESHVHDASEEAHARITTDIKNAQKSGTC